MLRKISLSLIACVIATQAGALELYKAKIIKYTTSTTGNITATYKSASSKKLTGYDNFYSSELFSEAVPQSIPLGEFSPIESTHEIDIRNEGETTQNYTMKVTSCISTKNNDATDGQCAFANYTIAIEPSGYFIDTLTPELLYKATDLNPRTSTSTVNIYRQGTTPEDEASNESSSASSDIYVTVNQSRSRS